LALDRSPRGAEPAPAAARHARADRGHHRAPAPPSPWHGRAAIAAVATGATVAAGYCLTEQPLGNAESTAISELASSALIQNVPTDLDSRARSVAAARESATAARQSTLGHHHRFAAAREDRTGGAPGSALAMAENADIADVASLTKAVQVGEQLTRRAKQLSEALAGGAPAASVYRGAEFVRPTTGNLTSGYGARWGVVHYGIDLANRIGTPIYAVTDGTVISSGPASGFGMWVRLRHPGGWISVYGHINRSLVHVGETVKAGEKIAEMGNRGESTGPHLHFEVWDPKGKKINPLPWLTARGIHILGLATGLGAD
jgi:murein DD-endopeptidase MepM/ murein hydrolase activator NlpD